MIPQIRGDCGAVASGKPSRPLDRVLVGENALDQSSTNTRLLGAVGMLTLLAFAGAVGFRVVEGMSWVNALYMTVITLSTVGFAKVQVLSPAGRRRDGGPDPARRA